MSNALLMNVLQTVKQLVNVSLNKGVNTFTLG